jgi:hypothetical protein
MRRLLLKTAFVVAVLLLWLVFLVPAIMVLETLLPSDRGGDRLLPGGLLVFACIYAANRIVSFLFRSMRLSDERWSLFARRTFG